MKKSRTRRLRRKMKAILKHGPTAGPKHTSKSGRTGSIRSKQRQGMQPVKKGEPHELEHLPPA